ncbi:MAG: GDSL-type esterase/lipase family protein [Gammaproteobacteria bacterium]
MIKKTFIILVVILLSGCDKDRYPLPKLSENAVILAFGDSLTYGTGASRRKDYPSVLTEMTSLEVINEGVPGEISRNGAKRLPGLLDRYRPDLLILTHGGNDMIRRIPRSETEANLAAMIEEALKRNVAVILLGVPKPGLLLLDSDEIYRHIADRYQIPSDLNVIPAILGDSDLKSDAVHPNDQGYRLLARSVYELMSQNGAL